SEHRLLLFRIFDRYLVPLYGQYLESVNAYLAGNGILPNLHYVPVRARPASPGVALPRGPAARADDGRGARRGAGDGGDGDGGFGLDLENGPRSAAGGRGANRAGAGSDTGTGASREGERPSPGPGGAARDAANDAFQQMRHLLAGRRQLLGKLGGGGGGGGG